MRSPPVPSTCGRSSKGSAASNGWYSWRLAWWVRGVLDRMVGGPGLRRGRRNPRDLVVGDALDFWRVEETDDHSFVRLRAEMKLPGLAWLELQVGSDRWRHDDVPPPSPVPPARAVRAPLLVGRSTRSTGSSSARCSATSPRRPRRSSRLVGDDRLDRRADDDGAGHGAETIVRLGDRTRQDLARMVTVGAVREGHVERHLDVGQPVAELVADLVGADREVERSPGRRACRPGSRRRSRCTRQSPRATARPG